METTINKFGEKVTKWKSTKHPDNPNFMQIVRWFIYEKPDGRVTICYDLGANGKTYFLYNLTKDEAIELYSDSTEYQHNLTTTSNHPHQ